jgi:hypothetical protein
MDRCSQDACRQRPGVVEGNGPRQIGGLPVTGSGIETTYAAESVAKGDSGCNRVREAPQIKLSQASDDNKRQRSADQASVKDQSTVPDLGDLQGVLQEIFQIDQNKQGSGAHQSTDSYQKSDISDSTLSSAIPSMEVLGQEGGCQDPESEEKSIGVNSDGTNC